MTQAKFRSLLPSWSVEYHGEAYDDAREAYGMWFYRDILTGEIRPFRSNRVVKLCRNDVPDNAAEGTAGNPDVVPDRARAIVKITTGSSLEAGANGNHPAEVTKQL